MSIVIGYVDDKVYMACDTARTLDEYIFSDDTETGMNVFHLPNGVLCGATSYSVKQIIKTNPQWFDNLGDEPLTKKYIAREFVVPLYDSLDDLGRIDDKKESEFDGAILLAKKDRLFCIDSDFSVHAIPKFCVIGKGFDFAVPRVLLRSSEPISDMAYNALADARTYLRRVREPFYLFTTDSLDKQRLTANKEE